MSLLTSLSEDHPGHKLRGGLVTHHNIDSLMDLLYPNPWKGTKFMRTVMRVVPK